jgi:hypothetical protein
MQFDYPLFGSALEPSSSESTPISRAHGQRDAAARASMYTPSVGRRAVPGSQSVVAVIYWPEPRQAHCRRTLFQASVKESAGALGAHRPGWDPFVKGASRGLIR